MNAVDEDTIQQRRELLSVERALQSCLPPSFLGCCPAARHLHRGPEAGPEREGPNPKLLSPDLTAGAGEAAQPGEAAPGVRQPEEAAGAAPGGEAEEREGVGSTGEPADGAGGPAGPAGGAGPERVAGPRAGAGGAAGEESRLPARPGEASYGPEAAGEGQGAAQERHGEITSNVVGDRPQPGKCCQQAGSWGSCALQGAPCRLPGCLPCSSNNLAQAQTWIRGA